MKSYVTKRCPHCGFEYQVSKSDEQYRYGCPHKICEKCLNDYWDNEIVEPALYDFNSYVAREKDIWKAFGGVIWILPQTLISLVGGIYLLIKGSIFITLVYLAIGSLLFSFIISEIKAVIDDKRRRNEILKKRREEYDRSMERLKDINYLAALADFDENAKKLLNERINGDTWHYEERP